MAGSYRFTQNTSSVWYSCPGGKKACRGGKGAGEQLCGDGYQGPLCSRCRKSYYEDSWTATCMDCRECVGDGGGGRGGWVVPQTLRLVTGIFLLPVSTLVSSASILTG